MRSKEEILARLEELESDFFGWRTDQLLRSLRWADLPPMPRELLAGAKFTPETWDAAGIFDDGKLREEAKDYYFFALSKIEDHRGISASRSVDRMEEMMWLLGYDLEEREYRPYGAPIIKHIGELLGLPWPEGDERMALMGRGLPCEECE